MAKEKKFITCDGNTAAAVKIPARGDSSFSIVTGYEESVSR